MRHAAKHIEAFLDGQGVDFAPHSPEEKSGVHKRWLEAYAAKVKRATGSWIYNGFRWHGFSWDHEAALEGDSALKTYLAQWSAPYVIFDEEGNWSYGCRSERYPDFTHFGADIYVAHHNMKWTMAFTHEQPHIGPFFAEQGRTSGR